MKIKLLKEDTLKMVKLYKKHAVLWDMHLSDYRRADLKKEALEKIAIEMNLPVEDTKRKLKSLRGTYIAEKKKVDRSKRSGCDEAVYVPSLFWYHEMRFLDSSIIPRITRDIYNEDASDDVASFMPESDHYEDFEDSMSSQLENYEDEYISNAVNSPETVLSSPMPITNSKASDSTLSKFDEALNVLLRLNKEENEVFSAFGQSVAAQLRDLPEEEAYPAMSDIQDILLKRKMNHLLQKQAQKRRKQ